MKKRPNYLFIITDQQRADHLGCYGNKVVRTPHIDSIAEKGTRFENFYVANPICMPNRASILTGRYSSLHGVRHNGIPLSNDSTTFVEVLRDAGYKTALVGKSHIQNMTESPTTVKYTAREGFSSPGEHLREANKRRRIGDEYEREKLRRWHDSPDYRLKGPYYGFDHLVIANGHGDQVGGDYEVWLNEKCDNADELKGKKNAIEDPRYSAPQAWRTRIPEALYPTSFIAEKAQEFIEQQAASEDESPFFLTMSFPDPHHPYTPPGKYWDMYDPDEIPLPSSFGKGDIPPLKAMREALRTQSVDRTTHDPFAVTEREAREIIALTYGSMTMIDDAVGRVLEALDRCGFSDDTIVCFTSDHGDYMGDHGIMLKMLLHFRGLVRVPFIWYDPFEEGGKSLNEKIHSSVDIAPSILCRSEIEPFLGVQGMDFNDPALPAREGVLVEEDSQRTLIGFDKLQRVRTYITNRWRLSIRIGEDWGELYDLESDPEECVNLWDDPKKEEVKKDLMKAMVMELISLQDTSPMPTYKA